MGRWTDEKYSVDLTGRIGYVALVMIGVLVILVFRYAYLQIVQGDALAQRMRDQSGYEFRIQSCAGRSSTAAARNSPSAA